MKHSRPSSGSVWTRKSSPSFKSRCAVFLFSSLAHKTAFDAILLVILASVLSRAINGSASFFPTLGGSLVIVLFHRSLGFAASRWHWFGALLKGGPEILILNGEIKRDAMRRNHISDHDLEEDMRLEAQVENTSQVRVARIERSGDISFIKKQPK